MRSLTLRCGPRAAPLAGLYRLAQAGDVRLAAMAPALALAEVVVGAPVIAGDPVRGRALLGRSRL